MKVGLLSYPGSPLLYPTIEGLHHLGYHDIVVISDGDELNQKFISIIQDRTQGKALCHRLSDYENLQIPFYFVKDHNSPTTQDLIRDLGILILGSCGTPRKLKAEIFDLPRFGVVNCHPGRLPQYRGSSSVEWALINGDAVASTSHFMVTDYDAGPIISVEEMSVSGLDYPSIRLKMIGHQASHLARAIHQVLSKQKPPSDYAPQGPGKVWEVFPDSRLPELLNRKF